MLSAIVPSAAVTQLQPVNVLPPEPVEPPEPTVPPELPAGDPPEPPELPIGEPPDPGEPPEPGPTGPPDPPEPDPPGFVDPPEAPGAFPPVEVVVFGGGSGVAGVHAIAASPKHHAVANMAATEPFLSTRESIIANLMEGPGCERCGRKPRRVRLATRSGLTSLAFLSFLICPRHSGLG
jgi:hypothetical protein